MGSKRALLQNGLGEILRQESHNATRVVDLFSGSGSVAWFCAVELNKPVLAVDLQQYSAVLNASVICRTEERDSSDLGRTWLSNARALMCSYPLWERAKQLDEKGLNTATWRKRAQEFAANYANPNANFLLYAYGGHYYSPTQTLSLQSMIEALPHGAVDRSICLAATLMVASQCAAAPGHTAQPLRATRTGARYIRAAWKCDPLLYAQHFLDRICPFHAHVRGEVLASDANTVASQLRRDDLVFIDPPYSGVHYSRFYHVLEAIATGWSGVVTGSGRYPPPEIRPNSEYSKRTTSFQSMSQLIEEIARHCCTAIITFPDHDCSNGLSGDAVEDLAQTFFNVTRHPIASHLSTLGGRADGRGGRLKTHELVLILHPKLRVAE